MTNPSFDLCLTPPTVLMATQYRFQKGEAIGPLWCESLYFIFVNDGKGKLQSGERSFALGSGKMVYIPWLNPILIEADAYEPCQLTTLHLTCGQNKDREAFSHSFIHSRPLSSEGNHRPPQPFNRVVSCMVTAGSTLFAHAQSLTHAFACGTGKYRLIRLDSLALLFFLDFLESVEKSGERKPVAPGNAVEWTLYYLNRFMMNPISATTLAHQAGMSYSKLSALFRKTTGLAPIAYLIKLRLDSACRLLATTNLNIREIGNRTGFQDQAHFSKLFKKHYGISPEKFRSGKS